MNPARRPKRSEGGLAHRSGAKEGDIPALRSPRNTMEKLFRKG